MNTFVKAIVLSLSTALVAAPVMAAPQDHRGFDDRHATHAPVHQQKNGYDQKQYSHHNQQYSKQQYLNNSKKVNPSRDWKVGQKVPAQYRVNSYKVDHKLMKKMSKPAKNQQWIKINGDYVLVNAKSNTILKIING
ncbi:RcnB family protein [Acinetobacter shaoyimingii]|uniref:RcnB family protein n=1 Tax=Acinetobacter shaoyimingii TaxID=2715164 RepID=A0A6G8RZ34_9GAMM|nr:RcnB family protein [Acinetobacter shaoyimingii]NHB59348.1 hypothetical protein [Acinetobacter shaoyimingii]QIO07199.1 hypothetical protein G8E00_15295 [Acinetobacter shaoyimingii]